MSRIEVVCGGIKGLNVRFVRINTYENKYKYVLCFTFWYLIFEIEVIRKIEIKKITNFINF